MTNKAVIPHESEEQSALFRWAELNKAKLPCLRLLYAVPNGGSRNKLEAVNLKRQGVRSGVPDMCLPVARGGYHGLYIELKRRKGGKLTSEQSIWLKLLAEQGYRAEVCCGFLEAKRVIEEYLRL